MDQRTSLRRTFSSQNLAHDEGKQGYHEIFPEQAAQRARARSSILFQHSEHVLASICEGDHSTRK